MATRPTIDDLPDEMLCEILSRLRWAQQMDVRRVSRRWKAAVDACLAVRREISISWRDFYPHIFDSNGIDKSKPCLELPISVLNISADNVVLRPTAVEQLCAASPRLQTVTLYCRLEKASVRILMSRLPDLRSLDLISVEGDWLHLLPAGLQSLTLSTPLSIDTLSSDSLRHLRRCPQLRQLHLKLTGVLAEGLTAVLAACPQLERLTASAALWYPPAWTRELPHRPQLRELNILGQLSRPFDITGALTVCSRLERLRVHRILESMPFLGDVSLPGIIHLELCHTRMDDATLWRLGEMMPNTRFLKLEDTADLMKLSESRLARGLQRLTRLRTLDLGETPFAQGHRSVLPLLSGLTLSALAFRLFDIKSARDSIASFQMAELLRHCPTLTVIRVGIVTDSDPEVAFLVERLVEQHLQMCSEADVTLLIETGAWRGTATLPRNIRVMKDASGVWSFLTGWQRVR